MSKVFKSKNAERFQMVDYSSGLVVDVGEETRECARRGREKGVR